MTRFIQLHLLVSYPPGTLNRDDLGHSKTATMGGVERLRISSQSLKRAWRTSEVFQQALSGAIGERTKLLGIHVCNQLKTAGIKEKDAQEWASEIAGAYGKVKKDNPLEIEQFVHIAPEEKRSLDALIATLATKQRKATKEELDALLHAQNAADIAMFGRMLASKPDHNTEAAVQVAHAIGVHASAIEDKFFTAADDLNKDDSGAAHFGETPFSAAVFYEYICIDRNQLVRNLNGNEELTRKILKAFTELVLTVGPTGKQNSFASRAYAHYAIMEKGTRQPRSLSLAFLKPVTGHDYATDATSAIETFRENMDKVYGKCAETGYGIDVLKGKGTFVEMINYAAAESGFGE